MTLSSLLDRLRKPEPISADARAPSFAQTHSTRGLPRFIATLGACEQPTLLDLGPVVGANVTFFGEELGCKIFVEDLSKDFDRHVRDDRVQELPSFLGTRFPHAAESFDAIICWDVFDYLDRPAAQALAEQLVRLLRPDGVILAFFNYTETPPPGPPTYTRHAVVDQRTLEYRPYDAARGKQRPLLNRDIQRLFEPLAITDQFLLKTNVREVLLRKPSLKS
ncbi:MAG TPA: methyltransferase [Vicinamibacterales bacterium]|nr:methyltransferase [Vicinamibacterales bacterium]